jgi:DNA-directed RNA polymerase subunit N (RpoN/RPB10)
MNVRCNYCGQTFNLSREFMVQAVAEAAAKRQKSCPIECFNCRKQIKVSVARMKPFAQAAAEVEEPEARAEGKPE